MVVVVVVVVKWLRGMFGRVTKGNMASSEIKPGESFPILLATRIVCVHKNLDLMCISYSYEIQGHLF